MKRLFLIILSLFSFGLANAQTISNVRSTFSCPGEMTINYDLYIDGNASTTNVTVSYRTDNGQTCRPCTTVTGDLYNQSSGSDKSVIWNLKANGFSAGFFMFKVEASPECVMINGACWATRNMDAPGTFAKNPEDAGMLYQWDSKVGWSSKDPRISTDSSAWNYYWRSYATTAWQTTNNICPAGYRVPTLVELQKLLDTENVTCEWIIQNGLTGRKFTDKATGNVLFLPAAGNRNGSGGTLYNTGTNGYYWSSTEHFSAGYAYSLNFSDDSVGYYNPSHAIAFSIRAVVE